MHHYDLILTLTSGLAAALALGFITHKIGLSPIVGYLLAGIAVGPHTPGFVADPDLAEQLAEIGVILLMFGVGLHFHLDDLLSVRRVALPGAVGQCLFATILGAVTAHAFGWSWTAGFVFGLAISVASTVVLLRVLADAKDLHTRTGHIAVGWLVVEDLFTVLVLVLLPPIVQSEGSSWWSLPLVILFATGKILVLFVFTLLVGGKVIPWLLAKVAATSSRELFTLTVLVVALGIAAGSAKVFGVSMALGAFLAGMVVGRSEFSLRAATEALPMRDAFAVLFFVSVGMLLNPTTLTETPLLLIATLAIIVIGKPFAAVAIVLLLGYPLRIALAVAVALAQIGEFSFILAGMGKQLGVLPEEATNVLVTASIMSITLNPILYRNIGPFIRFLNRNPNSNNAKIFETSTLSITLTDEQSESRDKVVIIGYGPVGRTLCRLLRENGLDPVVIELNIDTVRRIRDEEVDVHYGDAAQRNTLESAGVREAVGLILSSAGMPESREVIRLAKEINPEIHILVRANYLAEVDGLKQAGADEVFSGEGEVAMALIESVLRPLGATVEEIDNERNRFRLEGGII